MLLCEKMHISHLERLRSNFWVSFFAKVCRFGQSRTFIVTGTFVQSLLKNFDSRFAVFEGKLVTVV